MTKAAVAGRMDPLAAYELWADTYPAEAHNPLMRLEQQVVERMITTLRPTRALDVGTGSGRYRPVLERAGAATVVGLDFSMAMLRAGRRPPSAPGGRSPERGRASARVCADARRLPFRARAFDLINASLMAGDIADLSTWLRELSGALRRGGHLIYSDFHPSWTEHGWTRTFRTRNGDTHDLAFAPHAIDDHLSAIAGAGLSVIAVREPRFNADADPRVRAFTQRWGNPAVVVVLHARNTQ